MSCVLVKTQATEYSKPQRMSPLVYPSGATVLNASSFTITLESMTISQIAINLMPLFSLILLELGFFFTQSITWNKIMSYRNSNRCMFKLISKTLLLPIKQTPSYQNCIAISSQDSFTLITINFITFS